MVIGGLEQARDARTVSNADGPILFLIPARGGSRRLPDKNLRTVAGIPLVGWAARTASSVARRLGPQHAVVCSTDSREIATAARAWGAETPFVRPDDLAGPDATSVDVAIHALDTLASDGRRFATLVLVQPTSPLIDPLDLLAGLERFRAAGTRSVAAVAESHPTSWHIRRIEAGAAGGSDQDGSSLPLELSGGDPVAADDLLLTGAFYVIDAEDLRRRRRFVVPDWTLGCIIPPDHAVDIDEPLDLVLAEAIAAHRPLRALRIGERSIGDGRVFVIAEAGVNHNGRADTAHRLVDAAADAGADAVKFQTFDPAALAVSGAPLAAYQRASGEPVDDQLAMLQRLALPTDAWPALQAHARDRGLIFFSTPFDPGSAELLDRLDVPAFKVGSGELTNHPLLARLAGFGRPILLSTGMADMLEVAHALDVVADAGNPAVGLFHCVSTYPADPADADLRAMATLRAAFRVPVGWSDHSLGLALPTAAAALGADLVEKHLTIDATAPGPDHRASLEPLAFRSMVSAIRQATVALGTGAKVPAQAERETARVARRSLHWARSIPAGQTILAEDLVALRPGTGLSPARAAGLVGGRTTRAVRNGAPVEAEDAELEQAPNRAEEPQ